MTREDLETIAAAAPGYRLGKMPLNRPQADAGGAALLLALVDHYDESEPEDALRHALRDLMHGARLLGMDAKAESRWALADFAEDLDRIGA